MQKSIKSHKWLTFQVFVLDCSIQCLTNAALPPFYLCATQLTVAKRQIMSVECLSHALSETENKTTLSFASDAIWVCSRLRFCLFLQSFPNLGWFSSSAPSGKEMRMEWEHWCFQLCWKPLKKSHCCFKKLCCCADIERKLLLEGGLWRDCFLYLNSCKQPSKSGIPLTCCYKLPGYQD